MESNNEHVTAAGLEARFHSFIDTPLSELQENVAEEFVKIYSVTEWVNIAFIRTDDEISIEVEVSIPSSICTKMLMDSSKQMDLVKGMMTHILYIKKLLEVGFSLSIIKEDCLWVASYLEQSKPSRTVFEALVPPFVN